MKISKVFNLFVKLLQKPISRDVVLKESTVDEIKDDYEAFNIKSRRHFLLKDK